MKITRFIAAFVLATCFAACTSEAEQYQQLAEQWSSVTTLDEALKAAEKEVELNSKFDQASFGEKEFAAILEVEIAREAAIAKLPAEAQQRVNELLSDMGEAGNDVSPLDASDIQD